MPDPPEPLVSDADRESVVERLRTATGDGRLSLEEFGDRVGEVYRARTAPELARLTTDLPAVPVAEEPGLRPTRWVVGVFSGARRSGPWRPAKPTRAVAVFGSCQLDLSGLDFTSVQGPTGTKSPGGTDIEIVAVAVFGGVEVLVPQGVVVDLGGFAVFGGRDDKTSAHAPVNGPVVRVKSRALFGGVTVRTRPFTQR